MAAVSGMSGSPVVLFLVLATAAALVFVRHLVLLLLAIVFAALLLPIEIATGTEVTLNVAALLVPAATVIWLLSMLTRRKVALAPSRVNKPLLLFVIASLFSLLVGNVLWDPAVPRSSHFVVVQLAQWAIFALSAGAFILTANLVHTERQLRWLTFSFLFIGGTLALLYAAPGVGTAIQLQRVVTVAFIRAPLWILFTAFAASQLLYNYQLGFRGRLFCLMIIAATTFFCLVRQREVVSNWLGASAALATLLWLRWPRIRWIVIVLLLILAVSGVLTSHLYEFAGGEAEWEASGGSRMALIARVFEDTWARNPITGLGPAAYRAYGATRPLVYLHIVWVNPRISSHNNFLDLFAHTGILGLALFGWFVWELCSLGLKLRERFTTGFAAAYVNGMLAVGVASLAIMLLADWILPFVYNIGFPGFQASMLVWIFLGGLVALEQIPELEDVKSNG